MAPPPATLARLPTSAWVLVGVLVLVVGFWLGVRLSRWILRYRVARTRRTGRRGEARSLTLLAKSGYTLLEREATAPAWLAVDGQRRDYLVRADALVKRKGRVYVAEFKGGQASSKVTHRDTRRQLLEYAHVFDVDGVLLVDADAGSIHGITFPR